MVAGELQFADDSKIVGGQVARKGEFPWIISLWNFENPSRPYNFCGGSLVHKKYVMNRKPRQNAYPPVKALVVSCNNIFLS